MEYQAGLAQWQSSSFVNCGSSVRPRQPAPFCFAIWRGYLRRAASLLGHILRYAPSRRLARRGVPHPNGFAKGVCQLRCQFGISCALLDAHSVRYVQYPPSLTSLAKRDLRSNCFAKRRLLVALPVWHILRLARRSLACVCSRVSKAPKPPNGPTRPTALRFLAAACLCVSAISSFIFHLSSFIFHLSSLIIRGGLFSRQRHFIFHLSSLISHHSRRLAIASASPLRFDQKV